MSHKAGISAPLSLSAVSLCLTTSLWVWVNFRVTVSRSGCFTTGQLNRCRHGQVPMVVIFSSSPSVPICIMCILPSVDNCCLPTELGPWSTPQGGRIALLSKSATALVRQRKVDKRCRRRIDAGVRTRWAQMRGHCGVLYAPFRVQWRPAHSGRQWSSLLPEVVARSVLNAIRASAVLASGYLIQDRVERPVG